MAGKKPFIGDELSKVLAALEHRSPRDRLLVILGLNSGFRAAELLSLRVGQVWSESGPRSSVSVSRKDLKGGHGVRRRAVTSRSVPLNSNVTGPLETYIYSRFGFGPVDPEAWLFPSRFHGHRLTPWRANQLVKEIVREAGLEDLDHGTHSLRKTFAGRIYAASGHDLNLTRAVLGHRHITTTQGYLYLADGAIAEAIRGLAGSAGSLTPASDQTRNRYSA